MKDLLNKSIPKGCLIILLVFVGLFFSMVIFDGLVILTIFHLVAGWVSHASETLPSFFEKWRLAILPVGCLLTAGVLTHRFTCRWVEAKRPEMKWRIRYTALIFSLLLLGSGAAIAMSGMVHQFFWLSKEETLTKSSRGSERAYAVIKVRDLCQYMFFYFDENGKYPQSWDELQKWNDGYMSKSDFWFHGNGQYVPEPFIFLYAGKDREPSADEPLVLSPYLKSVDRYVIGFGDGSTRLVEAEELKQILSDINEIEEPATNE